jgi:hypothetical protein
VLVSNVINTDNTPASVSSQSAQRDRETMRLVVWIGLAMAAAVIISVLLIVLV